MELQSGGCRDGAAGIMALLGGVVLVVVLVLGARFSKDAATRAKAESAAAQAQSFALRESARYEHESELARLDAQLALARQDAVAHEQRLATLAVALKGMNPDADVDALLKLYNGIDAPWWEDWFVILTAAFAAMALFAGIVWLWPYLHHQVPSSIRRLSDPRSHR